MEGMGRVLSMGPDDDERGTGRSNAPVAPG